MYRITQGKSSNSDTTVHNNHQHIMSKTTRMFERTINGLNRQETVKFASDIMNELDVQEYTAYRYINLIEIFSTGVSIIFAFGKTSVNLSDIGSLQYTYSMEDLISGNDDLYDKLIQVVRNFQSSTSNESFSSEISDRILSESVDFNRSFDENFNEKVKDPYERFLNSERYSLGSKVGKDSNNETHMRESVKERDKTGSDHGSRGSYEREHHGGNHR